MSEDEDKRGSHLYPSLPQSTDLNKAENGNGYSRSSQNGNRKSSYDLNNPDSSNEKKDYKYFWRRVFTDLTNKNLIPVKILFFFKYATLFVLYPFLTIHMKSLGLDEWEIGVNQASVPIVAILGPFTSGLIADKIGNFKVVLAFITLANAAVALLLLLVPVARETVLLPTNLTFEIGCDSTSHNFILKSIDPYDCTLTNSWSSLPHNNVLQCGRLCRRKSSNNGTLLMNANDLDEFPSFPLDRQFVNFSVALNNVSYQFYGDLENRPKLECSGSSSSVFQEECKIINAKSGPTNFDDSVTESLTTEQSVKESMPSADYFSLLNFSKLRRNVNIMENVNNSAAGTGFNVFQPEFLVEGSITFDGQQHDNLVCGQQQQPPNSSSTEDDQFRDDCETKCFLQMTRQAFCSNDKTRKVYSVWTTFGVYTAFRLLLGFASATSFIMFEGAVLAILKQYGGDYGLQRVSATFAAIISAPLSGILLQKYSFRPVFYLYAFLQAISAFLTLKIDLKFKKPSDNVIGHLKEVLTQAEILLFFIAMLCSGTAWGYLETFLFLFLQKLGGSETLMGLTISVGGFFGLPFLIFSRPLIKKVGHVNILCIGLLFYGFRLFGYSFINNPWLCLPFEAMEAITSSLAVTAAATYAASLSTLTTIATVQGIMGALYFGIGRGAGSFIGGMLIREYGHRQTFQIFGIGSFLACILYMLVNVLYIRRHSKVNRNGDPNNSNGLVISNGSAKLKSKEAKEQFQMKPANHDTDLGYGKVNPGFDEGDADDAAKFTDIPLDEDNNSTLSHSYNHQRV